MGKIPGVCFILYHLISLGKKWYLYLLKIYKNQFPPINCCPAEIKGGFDELDNLLRIPSPLITEGANLWQYRNESPSSDGAQGREESYLPTPFDLTEENAPDPAGPLQNPSLQHHYF